MANSRPNSRPRRVSRARYTSPTPPAPIGGEHFIGAKARTWLHGHDAAAHYAPRPPGSDCQRSRRTRRRGRRPRPYSTRRLIALRVATAMSTRPSRLKSPVGKDAASGFLSRGEGKAASDARRFSAIPRYHRSAQQGSKVFRFGSGESALAHQCGDRPVEPVVLFGTLIDGCH
jgi:hypothetical protein